MAALPNRRKYADRARWARVTDRRFAIRRLETPAFQGFVTRLDILGVAEPLVVHELGLRLTIADLGYVWLQHFPDGADFALTTVLEPAGAVVHWYLDVAAGVGVSEEGVPYWDDLYLDVIKVPGVGAELIDEDDLARGLADGEITEADAEAARRTAALLLEQVRRDELPLLELAASHAAALVPGRASRV